MTIVAEPGGGSVLAAPSDVDLVLDALIENALAYAPRGSTVAMVAGPDALSRR